MAEAALTPPHQCRLHRAYGQRPPSHQGVVPVEDAVSLLPRTRTAAASRRRKLAVFLTGHLWQLALVLVGALTSAIAVSSDQPPGSSPAPPLRGFERAVDRARPLVHVDFQRPNPDLQLGLGHLVRGGLTGPRDIALIPPATGSTTLTPVSALQGDAPRTVMVWFSTRDVGPQTLIEAGAPVPGGRFLIGMARGDGVTGIHVQLTRANVFVRDADLDDGRWHGVAVTLSGRRVTVAIDGRRPNGYIFDGESLTRSSSPFLLPRSPSTVPTPILLGSRGPSSAAWPALDGRMDELLIFDYALPAATVDAIFAAARPS